MVNSMIYSFTEKDMDFVEYIADVLGQKEKSKNKYNVFAKYFKKDELFKLAEEYRTNYRVNWFFFSALYAFLILLSTITKNKK